MKLNEALSIIPKCEIPKLEDHSVLQLIKKHDFYFPSPLQLVQNDCNSKFILFTAPGAVGKSALARHIAYTYGGLYWNTAYKPVGGTSFAGEIAHATGIGNGALQDQLYANLKHGKSLFVLDAFDEAALISRREGVRDFLVEIGNILDDAASPSVVLTARTEMSQFIVDVCREEGFGLTRYTIDYFEENDAHLFIESYLQFNKIELSPNRKSVIQRYINEIKQHIGEKSEIRSFIGYAQVLMILSRQIEKSFCEATSLPEFHLSSKIQQHPNNRMIYDIIQELINREQSKLNPFKSSIRDKYVELGKTHIIDSLFSKQEQLTRLQFYVLTDGEISIDDFHSANSLLPEDQNTYLELLYEWLPQHVFLQNKSIMPIFGDYLLAESLMDPDLELFAEEFQIGSSSAFKLPTRVFMDCYLSLNNDCVNSDHIYYLDLAYSSQAAFGDRAYCDIGMQEDASSEAQQTENLCLTFISSDNTAKSKLSIRIIRGENDPICLSRAEYMSVNVSGKVIFAPKFTRDVIIRQASIECDCLEFNTPEIIIESYGNEENQIIVHGAASRLPGGKITIKGTKNLKADFPWSSDDHLKRAFFELVPYQYSFDINDNNAGDCDDIVRFVHGMKKVLEQFKVDNYNNDPAKFKEKIDARCRTGVNARVLTFLKEEQLVYEDGHLYKCSLDRMNDLQVSRSAYIHSNYEQLKHIYNAYVVWYGRQQSLSYV